jgi:MFS family permease
MLVEGWVRQVAFLVSGLLCLFVSVTLLVAVIPPVAERVGGSTGAGLATAAFYFPAACVQLATPWLLRRAAAGPLLVAALLLAGAPSILYVAVADSLPAILVVTAVRGAGFGLATVALITFVAQSAPAERRGTVIGTAGLAAGLPFIFAPAAGAHLTSLGHESAAFTAAAAIGLLGAVAVVRVVPPELPTSVALRLWHELTTSLRWPFAWFLLVSLTRGAVISFVPLRLAGEGLDGAATFFLVFGAFAYATRWLAGWLADRLPTLAVTVPGIACLLIGLVVLAAGVDTVHVLVSAFLYGVGTGTAMTMSQLDMLSRSSVAGFAVPTALWNVSIDFGVGLGGVLFGVLAASAGYDVAFWLLPGVMALVLVIVLLEPRRALPTPSPDVRPPARAHG